MSLSCATSAVRLIMRMIAGWSGWYMWATCWLPRSMASAYWIRSLVPMLKKSTSRASTSAMITAEGTSIMIPSAMSRL